MTSRTSHSVYNGWRIYAPPTTLTWTAHRLGEPPIEGASLEEVRRLIDKETRPAPVRRAPRTERPVAEELAYRGW